MTPSARLAAISRPVLVLLAALGILVVVSMLPTQRAGSKSATRPEGTRLSVACTFLPMYVFTRNVVGDTPGVQVELLVAAGVGCPHDYAVRPRDRKLAADADVIVANGLGLDAFVKELTDDPGKILYLAEGCDVIRDGQADEHDHDHGHDHAGHDDHAHGPECNHGHDHGPINPHVWVSPRQAAVQVRALGEGLAARDPEHAAAYRANAAAYIDRLNTMYERMRAASQRFANRRIVTFHDALAYLARDLDLEVVATLTQDPEHAPSARRIADTIGTIRETRPAAIFFEPAYSDRLARSVSSETGVPMYALNPFNTVEGTPGPRSYEDVMEQNLRVLIEALGGRP
jgi:zinc transport system substrate-binding protein